MRCPVCQSVNPETARFCNNCGNRLQASQPLQAPQPARSIEGERKIVTILFADVVGSTAMGEQLDPEQVTEIMNGVFARVNAAITRYGGTVARLMGDAVLAFFGAPVSHEDDPERAVRAGLDIQAASQEYAQEIEQAYGLGLQVRVGINTGVAVLDVVGDQTKTEYTAMGDATNVASRMQSAARPGTVLISADTHRLVKNLFDFNPRGEIVAKGKSEPVEAYEVVGPKETPGKARGLEGLTSPLVGRDTQFRLLQQRIEALKGGRGGFVSVIGEAGLGKSRLVAEARSFVLTSEPQVAWLEGRALSYGQSISYHPWRQIIRQSIGAREADPPESVREKLKTVCTNDSCNMPGGDVPFLEVMLAVESEESLRLMTGLDGDVLVRYLTQAVRGHICCTLAQVMPTVLVFDDLHWADQASLDLLLNIADLVEMESLLVICLLRPDKGAASWAAIEQAHEKLGEHYHDITLEPLSTGDSRELLGNLLHIEELPDSVRNLILEKAEGNPFFVEEVIRSLINSRHIVQENSHWRATQEIVHAAIPDTLAGVLSTRIDRLPGETKRVTQAASVVGRIFAQRVLKAICESAPLNERIERLEPHLDVLSYEELVRERTREPELEYIFKHVLTQEAAYNSLLIRRRKEYHRRTADVLEQLYPERLDELAPTLALHCWQGEDWARAADYSMRAGAGAVKLYAMRAAIDHYRQAIQAVEKTADASPEKLYDAIMGWVEAAFRFTSYEEILVELDRAVTIARSLGDKRRLAKALHLTGSTHISRGHATRGFPALVECFALAEELGDEALALLPMYTVAFTQIDADPRGAIARLRETADVARKLGNKDVEAGALASMAIAAARVGEFRQAQEAIRASQNLASLLNSPLTESDVDLFSAWSYLDMNDPEQGLRYAQRGIQKAVSADNVECVCYGYACLGFSYMQAQKLPEAIKAFGEAIKRSVTSGAEQVENIGRMGLAIAQFYTGRPEAVRDMEMTLEKTRDMGDPYTSAFLSYALGESYMQLGDYERAESYLGAALDHYRSTDMRPYLLRTLQSLASLYDKQRRATEAARIRGEAEELVVALQVPA